MTEPLNYESTGVNYDVLDAFKRHCQKAAAKTVAALAGHGVSEPAGIRGESAYLVETPDEFLAHTGAIAGPVTHVWIDGGRHDLKGHDDDVAATVGDWLRGL